MPTNDCFLISLKNYEVRKIAPMNVARVSPGVIENDGKVMVFGGETGIWANEKLSECEEYDLKTGLWRQITAMTLPKGHLTPVPYKSRILLAGGELNQIEAYIPSEDHFDSFYAGYNEQVLMAISFADDEFFYTLRKNKLYIHVFNSDFDQLPEVKVLDIPYNIWLSKTLPVRLGTKVYMAVRDEVWSFDTKSMEMQKEITL